MNAAEGPADGRTHPATPAHPCQAASAALSPPETPAERLHRAALLIERRAAEASDGPWRFECPGDQTLVAPCDWGSDCDHRASFDGVCALGGFDADEDNRWAALLGPQIAAPLAAWLRDAADSAVKTHALALADAILGEVSR